MTVIDADGQRAWSNPIWPSPGRTVSASKSVAAANTRALVRPHLARVTVAPITTTVRGLSTEVAVGRTNGLQTDCVVSCDNIVTVPKGALGPQIGHLWPAQEQALTAAIQAALDLDRRHRSRASTRERPALRTTQRVS